MKKESLDKLTRHPLLTPALLALAAACLGVLSLWFAVVDNRNAMFLSYFTHPLIALLNLLPVLLLALLLYFLIGRAWIAYGLTVLVVLGFTAGNFFKLTFRNDPVLFEDLLLLKEAGDMAGKYRLFLNKSMVFAIVLVLLGGAALFFLARAKTGWKPRLLCALVTLLIALPLSGLYANAQIYENATRNEDLISRFSATQVYTSKGFVYPFLYSVKSASDAPPEGYDADRAERLLAAYEDAAIPDGEKADVIAIQLEAFNDFTKWNVPGLNPEVYALYHELEAESYTGNLVTNIFAGGTVDTERCFLTGFSELGSFRGPTNSYVRYFKDQGYFAEGSHPCYSWFYNRANINANLGFDDYWFVENYYGAFTDNQPGADAVLFPHLMGFYNSHAAASAQPYFSFNVTYQGHGPYADDRTYWGDGWVEDGVYADDVSTILNNYFGSVHNTSENLKLLLDRYREAERPLVVVIFGDHNPWMGDANSIYDLLGVDLDVSTKEGFLNYYATRYLIWANDAAKEALGNDFQGEGPDIGPYFLMNELFRLCGWEGPAYLQAVDPVSREVPVMNAPTGLYLERGVLTDSLSDAGAALAGDYESLQYYWRRHYAG